MPSFDRSIRRAWPLLWLAAFQDLARAEVRLPAVLSSHMVVQQEAQAPFWGWAEPGERVIVRGSWSSDEASATADAKGEWRVALRTPKAGGPFEIAVRGANEIVLEDVWSGEVWLCSGQSNMEMPLGNVGPWYTGVLDYEREIANANHPRIRLFDVENALATAPARDCKGAWRACAPEVVERFSATGYFFARELERELGVPIGIVAADWGGTVAQAWTSGEALAGFPEHAEGLARLAKLGSDPESAADEHRAAVRAWWEELEKRDVGSLQQRWMRERLADHDWPTIDVPGLWTGELADFDGVVWYRIGVVIPGRFSIEELDLELGPIDDMDTVWFDGLCIGRTEELGRASEPRRYRIPAELRRNGAHELAIRIVDLGGDGGIGGPPEQIGLRIAGTTGAKGLRSIAGRWRYKVGAKRSDLPRWPRDPATDPNQPSALYNGMIAPIAPIALRGALWYQGESNRPSADRYDELLAAMIADWRARFANPTMPFFVAQIAPYRYGDLPGAAAEIREAQRQVAAQPHNGLVVTADIGELDDIHPRNKQEVGRRFALLARRQVYGAKDLVASGPMIASARRDGASVRVAFDHAAGLRCAADSLAGFELAGEGGEFVPASARIDGESVVLEAPSIAAPAQVRYAFADDAITTLVNAAGLPASPFRARIE